MYESSWDVSLQVAPLAALVQRLKLEVYSLKREEGEHEALLGLLADLALKQREDDAISECLASLHHCATEGPDTLRVCLTLRVLSLFINITWKINLCQFIFQC